MGKKISDIRVKLIPTPFDEKIKLSEIQYELIIDSNLKAARSYYKYSAGIDEHITKVLYYMIRDKYQGNIEIYINDKDEVVLIRLMQPIIPKFFKTSKQNELRNLFSTKYKAYIQPDTNANLEDQQFSRETYENSEEKWKAIFDFTSKGNAVLCTLFRTYSSNEVTANPQQKTIPPTSATGPTHGNVAEGMTARDAHVAPQEATPPAAAAGPMQGNVAEGMTAQKSEPASNPSSLSTGTMIKLVIALILLFLIVFMGYGFILWKKERIICFFTGAADYITIFFAVTSIPVILIIFSGSSNETEQFIMHTALIVIPSVLTLISMGMTFFTNRKYGVSIPLALYATVYKLLCIIFIAVVFMLLIVRMNARNERKERLRRLLKD